MKYQLLLNPEAQTATGTGTTKPETEAAKIRRLTGELAAANRRLAAYEAADQERAETEKIVAAKMVLGLSREQALAVIERQKQFDKAQAATGRGKTGNAKPA